MTTLTSTDFRKRASDVLSAVEKGAAFVIVRHGKPIAELTPVSQPGLQEPVWRQPGLRLTIPGVSLSQAILDERGR